MCGRLLATNEVSADTSGATLNVDGTRIDRPVSLEDVAVLLRSLDAMDQAVEQAATGSFLGEFLGDAFLNHIVGAGEVIRMDAPDGQRLIESCRRYLPDPMLLEGEFRNLIAGN